MGVGEISTLKDMNKYKNQIQGKIKDLTSTKGAEEINNNNINRKITKALSDLKIINWNINRNEQRKGINEKWISDNTSKLKGVVIDTTPDKITESKKILEGLEKGNRPIQKVIKQYEVQQATVLVTLNKLLAQRNVIESNLNISRKDKILSNNKIKGYEEQITNLKDNLVNKKEVFRDKQKEERLKDNRDIREEKAKESDRQVSVQKEYNKIINEWTIKDTLGKINSNNFDINSSKTENEIDALKDWINDFRVEDLRRDAKNNITTFVLDDEFDTKITLNTKELMKWENATISLQSLITKELKKIYKNNKEKITEKYS